MPPLTPILDRGYGRPAVAVEHSGTIGRDVSELSDADRLAILAEDASAYCYNRS
jgi:hypothetical protein